MTTPTPNAAPPSCLGCRYVELITVKCEGREIQRLRRLAERVCPPDPEEDAGVQE